MRLGSRLFSSVNTKSILFGGVIIFACAAFIFTGFGSLHVGNLTGLPPNTAATVGKVSITMSELINILNEEGFSKLNPEQKKIATGQILKQLIKQKILANEALNMGWDVPDDQITYAIQSIPFFQDAQTHQFSYAYFKQYLANQQMSELEFYQYLRTQLSITQMQNLLNLPLIFTNETLKKYYFMTRAEYNLQYAIIQVPENTLTPKIEKEAKDFANNIANSGQLQNIYESQKDRFNKKAQTHVRSILISYKDASRAQGDSLKRNKNEALNLTQQLLAKLKQGSSFEKLASETNDDESAKKSAGDLGFVDETKIDTVSLHAIESLNDKNKYSDIVDTPFGFRLFQFVEAKPAITIKYENAVIDIAKELVKKQVIQNEESKIETELSNALITNNITQINKILADNNLSWKYLNKGFYLDNKFIPELGDANELSENIFNLKKSGDILPKIITFSDKKAIIKLASLNSPQEPSSSDLEKIKEDLNQKINGFFVDSVVKKFDTEYEKNQKVKINPVLTQ
jgi:peptidyl-prolyl cis-trans isomerase D